MKFGFQWLASLALHDRGVPMPLYKVNPAHLKLATASIPAANAVSR